MYHPVKYERFLSGVRSRYRGGQPLSDGRSYSLKAKSEGLCPTHPDLILQPDQPVRSGLIAIACGSQAAILTLYHCGYSNLAATLYNKMKCCDIPLVSGR
jgi:hypothetical protein